MSKRKKDTYKYCSVESATPPTPVAQAFCRDVAKIKAKRIKLFPRLVRGRGLVPRSGKLGRAICLNQPYTRLVEACVHGRLESVSALETLNWTRGDFVERRGEEAYAEERPACAASEWGQMGMG